MVIKWGHAIFIIICAAALGGFVLTTFNQASTGTVELEQTNQWYALLSLAGGVIVGAFIWLIPWPFIEMLWHRQLTDRAIYLMIVLNTIMLAFVYFKVAPLTNLIYPELGCVTAAIAIYYRNYTVTY